MPQTFQGRIFTCFFAVSGVAFLGIALGVMGSRFVEAQERAMRQASELSRTRALSLFTGKDETTTPSLQEQEQQEKREQGLKHIAINLAAVGVLLAVFALVLMNDPGIDVNKAASPWRQFGNALYFGTYTTTIDTAIDRLNRSLCNASR